MSSSPLLLHPARARRTLQYIVVTLIAGAGLGHVSVALFGPPVWTITLLLIDAALLATSWLLYRGRLKAASLTLPPLFLAFIVAGLSIGSGLHDPIMTGLPMGLILAGVLLGQRGVLAFGAASIVSATVLYALERHGVVGHPLNQWTDPPDLLNVAVILAISTALLYVLIGNLTWSVERTREQERALAVSHQRLAEQAGERERLIRALEARNAELERFTYTVSHDLRSPLVTVRGFLGHLERDVASGDAERVGQDIARILAATERMDRMLRELLDFSRIGRAPQEAAQVPLQEVAGEAIALVSVQIEERGVRIATRDGLPLVHADRGRLLELLQNLIDNAIKFMGDQPEPRIEIGARRDGGSTVLFVSDNGVGIPPRHRERVFGLFDRLDDSVDGTGIGLAVVKRIVESHGGRVWIESGLDGRGCSFCFTLGAPAEPNPGDTGAA